ncbi:MAG: heme ABC transporter permease CcmC [Gammaproteobacteria bacterium]|nr:heme ABC transporter permease CcmC [Gammaproteobacteria bacterium]
MWKFLYRLSSLKYYYEWSGKWVPWLLGSTAVLMLVGLYWGLVVAPSDYQQGESYRIIYVHVPSAWMSMFVYVVMAGAGFIAIVWRTKLSEIVVSECAVIGAMFTALALVTGMLWGKPTWGTYWQWDARLTSELILLFLYFGIIAVHSVIEESRTAARVASILAIIGVINIPIIHYSVTWWSSLHQPNMLLVSKTPSVHPSMLYPLLVMATAFQLYFVSLLFIRMRNAILHRERLTSWVQDISTRN